MRRAIDIITLRTTDQCPDNRTCPSIHAVTGETDRRYVITKKGHGSRCDRSVRPPRRRR
jgi:hypothetical protein